MIAPILKINNPSSKSDSRPISLLSIFSEVLERIVYSQFTSYLTDNALLDDYQAGFTKGHSTQNALLNVIDDIKKGIEERKVTVLVLFDFSKAFDMVDHSTLLLKIEELNFSNQVIAWLYSYLTG